MVTSGIPLFKTPGDSPLVIPPCAERNGQWARETQNANKSVGTRRQLILIETPCSNDTTADVINKMAEAVLLPNTVFVLLGRFFGGRFSFLGVEQNGKGKLAWGLPPSLCWPSSVYTVTTFFPALISWGISHSFSSPVLAFIFFLCSLNFVFSVRFVSCSIVFGAILAPYSVFFSGSLGLFFFCRWRGKVRRGLINNPAPRHVRNNLWPR